MRDERLQIMLSAGVNRPMAMVRNRAATEFSAVARTAISRVEAFALLRTDQYPARFLDTAKPDRSALRRTVQVSDADRLFNFRNAGGHSNPSSPNF
jgi:hypothetical protein